MDIMAQFQSCHFIGTGMGCGIALVGAASKRCSYLSYEKHKCLCHLHFLSLLQDEESGVTDQSLGELEDI